MGSGSIRLEALYEGVPEMMHMTFHSCGWASTPEGRDNDEIDERIGKEIGRSSLYEVGAYN